MTEEITERTERLKNRRLSFFSFDLMSSRAEIYTEIFEKSTGEPAIIQRAKALSAFLAEKLIFLEEDDLIAGYSQSYDYCELYNSHYLFADIKTISSLENLTNRLIQNNFWKDYCSTFRNLMTDEERETFDHFISLRDIGVYQAGFGHGHIIPGYQKVLPTGLGKLFESAQERLNDATNENAKHFLLSVCIVLQAIGNYVLRYAKQARELQNKTLNIDYRKELERIADSCEWVAVNPPRSFFEAIQLFWILHEILTIEQVCGSISPGRFDQYMYPYYRADVKEGRLSKEQAQELMDVLWTKFNIPNSYWGTLFFQNITLGGQTSRGEDATNDLSYLCLESCRRLKLPQPALSVRIHSKSPEAFFRMACEVVSEGGGLPAFFNDATIISAKTKLGIAEEDAKDYGIIGCVEPAVPGKEYGWTEGLRINLAKILELTLNQGVCLITDKKIRIADGLPNTFADFDEMYNEYTRQLNHFIDVGIKALNIADKYFAFLYPYPCLSILMEGCVEKGMDISKGGTKYNFTSINGCGMANVVDSLIAINEAVFIEKRITFDNLMNAIRSNFKNQEPLRQLLKNKYPKFGNDSDETDCLMKDLCEVFLSRIQEGRNLRDGKYQSGLYTVNAHAFLGGLTGALPDGRKKGVALANSFSPAQGRDKCGPTATAKSITRIDHSKLANGMVLDIKITPRLFIDAKGIETLRDFIKAYFQLGGMEVQFNVISSDTLKQAKEHPEEYQNLMVRVSGFSAFFVYLDDKLQDEIIERTEHASWLM
jgi:pyruvate formate-lyase/glycerol dehydratase family glycyl radical enzyme